MKIFASKVLNKIKFYPDQSEGNLELEVPKDKLDYWLKYDLDEYIEEFEELPRVEEDPLSDEWDNKYICNVINAADNLDKKGLLTTAICNYLNSEGNIDSFYQEAFEKINSQEIPS